MSFNLIVTLLILDYRRKDFGMDGIEELARLLLNVSIIIAFLPLDLVF